MFLNFMFLWKSNSNSFWHFKLSDFHPYFKLNKRSASKIHLFLSTVSEAMFLNIFSFKIHTVVCFDILNCQVFILTLNWTKDLHLKLSCLCLLSKNPHFWISFTFEIQTVIAFGISNLTDFHSYFELNQKSASKNELFLSTV